MEARGYPIRAVARLTGIPIDTLRAWERRYGVVSPRRDTRGRLYGDADVRKLRLLRALVERGHAIGRLAALQEKSLRALLDDPGAGAPPPRTAGGGLPALLDALDRFDAPALEGELARLATLLPPRTLSREVVLPFLRTIGDRWAAGELGVAHEHLASAALRSVLGSLLATRGAPRREVSVVFATPHGEQHELGTLAAALLAAGGGLRAIYLGPSLPASELADAVRKSRARALVLGVTAAGDRHAAREIQEIARRMPRGAALLAGGPAPRAVVAAAEAAGVTWIADFEALEPALRKLGAAF